MTGPSVPRMASPRAARSSRASPRARAGAAASRPIAARSLAIRRVRRADLDPVVAIDATTTGIEKRAYWESVYRRYGGGAQDKRQFLIAELERRVVGFVIGEVRDWEFGSAPCGWVFGLSVRASARLAGVGARMLEAICDGFRHAGVNKVRTLLARDNSLVLSFFRSQGMMAAPFIPLEMDLD